MVSCPSRARIQRQPELTVPAGVVPWTEVSLYVLFRWLDSGSGVSALKTYLWLPIDQYSYRSITTAAYEQVMSLSYDFHCDKKTGEIWASIGQGRTVNGIVDLLLFQFSPMVVDLFVAFAYFYILFNVYMAFIVGVVSVLYLWATAKMGSIGVRVRRQVTQARLLSSNVPSDADRYRHTGPNPR